MATPTENAIQEIYLGLLGRPADAAGLAYWANDVDNNGMSLAGVRFNIVNEQPEYETVFGGLSRSQTVNQLYLNLFNRNAEPEGLDYWVNGGGSTVPVDLLVFALSDGADATDRLVLDNQIAVANYITASGTADQLTDAEIDAILDSVGASNVADAIAAYDAAVAGPGAPDLTLTNSADNLTGTDGDDVFTAPLVQNQLGGVTNSLASDDQMHGGDGTDSLYANLVPETTAVGAASDVIKPVSTSLENAFFTMQTGSAGLAEPTLFEDIVGLAIGAIGEYGDEQYYRCYDEEYDALPVMLKNYANIHIDAQDMNGIEQLWSLDSRADLYIEDVRSRPQDVTIGMSGTDPQVSYFVDFDSDVIAGDFGNSAVTFEFANLLNPEDELEIGEDEGGWVGSLEFTLNGETYVVNGGDVADATTFAELEAAVEASLVAQGLTGLEVSLDTSFLNPVNNLPGATLTIFDPDGGIFSSPKTNVSDGAQAGALYFDAEIGAPEVLDVETNIILDNVGRNDQGGLLDIGGMSNQGIQIFNVEVDAKSWLAGLSSTSRIVNPYTDSHHHLEVVNVSHLEGGAMGDLVIGTQADPMNTDVNPTTLPTGARVNPNGLIDVREFNAAGFEGALNIGASLTEFSIPRYLDVSGGEEVFFNYTMGDGGSILTLAIDEDLSEDILFNLNLLGGDGDDRFNLLALCGEDFDFDAISIDGGLGFNTLEVESSIGLDSDPSTIPASFANIDKLVLAGANDVDADFSNLPGVTELVIATGTAWSSGYNSTIWDLDVEQTSVTISGKKQTMGTFNADNDQYFGTITFNDASDGTLLIDLENTARTSGELDIGHIIVNDATPETVILNTTTSDKNRVNSQHVDVNGFTAVATSTLIIQGELTADVEVRDMGEEGEKLVITGEDLEGRLQLDVNADMLTEHDADEGTEITGTAATNDRLKIEDGVLNTSNDTQISGFESIVFDDVEGLFDAGAVTGEETWDIEDTTGFFSLIGLSGDTTIGLDVGSMDGAAPGVGEDSVFLEGGNSGTLTLNLRDVDNSDVGRVLVQGFQEIVLNFESDGTTSEAFRLTHVDADGDYYLNDGLDNDPLDPSTSGYDPEAVSARTLVVNGGDAGDDLNLGNLSHVLNVIDISGYAGEVTFDLGIYDDALLDRNTTIIVGSGGLNFSETELGNDDHITTFRFTADTTDTWYIEDFDAFNAGATLSNLTVLDLSALGVTGFADLDFTDIGGDVSITSDVGLNFEIYLVGVNEADLSNENFGNFVI